MMPLTINTRGGTSLGVILGLPAVGVVLTAWAITIGVHPWVVLITAIGSALLGGGIVFLSHRFWGAHMLRKLDVNTMQLGTVATEMSIVSGELYHVWSEIASLRTAIGIPLELRGTHPPPAARGAEG